MSSPEQVEWWRHAAIYQVYPRSFADADGDGVGDLPGITARLPYLRDLGVDALWISPFYRSPQKDHGYDVSDYHDVDPLFGSLADADELLTTAHRLGLRIIADLVPNHSSDQHEWFQAALVAGPGSPERARYLFREGRGADGEEPPNNWMSVFGGPAWARIEGSDQWYLHLFDFTQPDLNWRNPEVPEMFLKVLRFWLDRGVDGFRVDVAHGMIKDDDLRDQVMTYEERQRFSSARSDHDHEHTMIEAQGADEPMWDQPEVHDIFRDWRKLLASYEGDRMAVAEAWTRSPEAGARYVRPDELQQAFNFDWLSSSWSAAEFHRVIKCTLPPLKAVGGASTWVLSNHDVPRHATRYGGGARGQARARAATLVSLALPGSAYLYQGEELGLEDVDVAPENRHDPTWFRTGQAGRDGCRVPIPWSGATAPYGFGPGNEPTWIPQPDGWGALSVAAQEADETSTLAFYQRALAVRREHAQYEMGNTFSSTAGDVLHVRRGALHIAMNCGNDDVPLPEGEVLISSGPIHAALPADTAVWLKL